MHASALAPSWFRFDSPTTPEYGFRGLHVHMAEDAGRAALVLGFVSGTMALMSARASSRGGAHRLQAVAWGMGAMTVSQAATYLAYNVGGVTLRRMFDCDGRGLEDPQVWEAFGSYVVRFAAGLPAVQMCRVAWLLNVNLAWDGMWLSSPDRSARPGTRDVRRELREAGVVRAPEVVHRFAGAAAVTAALMPTTLSFLRADGQPVSWVHGIAGVGSVLRFAEGVSTGLQRTVMGVACRRKNAWRAAGAACHAAAALSWGAAFLGDAMLPDDGSWGRYSEAEPLRGHLGYADYTGTTRGVGPFLQVTAASWMTTVGNACDAVANRDVLATRAASD